MLADAGKKRGSVPVTVAMVSPRRGLEQRAFATSGINRTPKHTDFATEARVQFLTLLLNAVEQAVFAVGRDGTILCWNRFAEKLYGWNVDEVAGKNVFNVLVREQDRRRAEASLASLAEAERTTGDWLLRRRNGALLPVTVTSTPIRDDDGNFVGVVGVSWDISEKQHLIGDRARIERDLGEKRQQLSALSRRLLDAQEAERKALSRELHDHLGQTLTAIRLNLEAARRRLDSVEGPRPIDTAIDLVDQTIEQVRSLALDLRPAMLDDLGLPAALRWLLKTQSQRAGVSTHLEVRRLKGRLAPAVETCCYRLVQEALTNIARHASASRVDVTVAVIDDDLHVTVRDDGKGFDVAAARRLATRGASSGLLSMEERATLIGGHLTITSVIGEGTIVEGRLPLAGDGG